MTDLKKLNIYSGVNYMKRSEFSDVAVVNVPATFYSFSVTHNLGYIPFYEVYAELDSGTIWTNGKVSDVSYTGILHGSAGTQPFIDIATWSTTNTLTVYLYNFPAVATTVPVYYTIYKDYVT